MLSIFPAEKIPKFVYYHVFCPPGRADAMTGEAQVAPLGLRRVESNLIDEFGKENVIISHCDHLEKSIGTETQFVGINVMDALGNGPLTTSLSGKPYTPYTRLMFTYLMKRIKKLKQQYGFKTVLGGSGAWQLHKKADREFYGIDHVVIGETDGHCIDMFYDMMDGRAPELMSVMTNRISSIPYIKGPTCNSTIEAMRGCGRGCDFCDPDRRKKRDFPIERLKQEAKINLDYGHTCIWLLSDEIMLYGCDNKNMYPNRDAIVDLYQTMKNMRNVDYVGTIHVTFSAAAADPECIKNIKDINNFGPSRWSAVQPGLETGSVEMFKKHMRYKSKPYSPEEWPEVVLKGLKVLNDNYFFTLCTLVMGLPGETDDDIKDTINLVKKLDRTPSVVAPLLWTDYLHPENSLTIEKYKKLQWKLSYLCWKISTKSVLNWIWYATAHFPPFIRQIGGAFGKLGAQHQLKIMRDEAKKMLGEDPDFDNI
jgi:radical SAM superfamily enzyme YgiQ (UPF0313 family)